MLLKTLIPGKKQKTSRKHSKLKNELQYFIKFIQIVIGTQHFINEVLGMVIYDIYLGAEEVNKTHDLIKGRIKN